jgi:DNA-binding transcriptional MerR regulator
VIASSPETQRKRVGRQSDPAWNAEPLAFRHFEQWQRTMGEIRPLISYRTAPQRQPPVTICMSSRAEYGTPGRAGPGAGPAPASPLPAAAGCATLPLDVNWQTRDYGVSELCEATGLSPRTVRYYEELGLLPDVRRRAGGRRVYGEPELSRLRFIGRLKALGLSLAEIRDLNAVYAIGGSTRAMLGRLDEVLAHRLRELDGRIAELSSLRDEIGKYRDHIAARVDALPARASR